jgi:predicted polyphosphate/ATP-dependent NAD kinase
MSNDAHGDRGIDEAYVIVAPGVDPAGERIDRERDGQRRPIVFVPDESVAPKVAAELVAEGIELVELYGGFGPTAAATVSAAIGGKVPVGHVTFGMESLVAAAAAHEARRSGRPTHWGLLDDGTAGEQLVREHGPHGWTAVELSDPADAPQAAVELVRSGVDLIEMPGGFETTTVAEVIAAVERKVPVGVISFGVEALAGAAAYSARVEAWYASRGR